MTILLFFPRYEDAFNRFIDEINLVAAFEWWEGSVHSILAVLAYPCAWSWKQWRRRKKIHRLQEYVKSEYDHSCLRSCRSRALYKGLKVSNHNLATSFGIRTSSNCVNVFKICSTGFQFNGVLAMYLNLYPNSPNIPGIGAQRYYSAEFHFWSELYSSLALWNSSLALWTMKGCLLGLEGNLVCYFRCWHISLTHVIVWT